ncbi:DUF2510 domain-containing protein [Streptomyces davaonensis]|nr:DUF2510 domain-containing protein [Streptomyces davaonensis]
MSPQPGWYPDPHAPHLERWWDGTAWTEHRRTPEVTAPVPTAAGPSGRAKAVAVTSAAVVLVAAIVTGAVVLSQGDDEGTELETGPTYYTEAPPSPTQTQTQTPTPTSSDPSADDPAVVTDELNGITLPLLDGWVRPKHVAEDDVVMTTDGTYDCPGDGGVCRHGLVTSRTITSNDERSPEALAKEDVKEAAENTYDRDTIGRRPYGGLESHEVVKSGPVAVAGRAGYFVRWKVTTAKGPGGYVQSTVFPSRVGTESPVCVRFLFDAGEDGPPLADMDRITKGIRSVDDPAGGGGVGSSVGPEEDLS